MRLEETILQCEIAYMRCFARMTDGADAAEFRDPLLPDMYYRNFTRIKRAENAEALAARIGASGAARRREGAGFCLVRSHAGFDASAVLPALPEAGEVSYSSYYALDRDKLPKPGKLPAINIRQVNNPGMLAYISAAR